MKLVSAAASLLVLALAQMALAAEEPRPNVVLILADDQGYADLGCYGATDLKTPKIDSLARDGTRFTSFYVAQAVCTASRAALLTGCYPNRISMAGALNHTSTVGIHPDEVLLSNLFKQRGYATAIYGKWHLGHQPPFLPTRRGFDEFFGLPYSNDNGPLHPVTKGIPALPLYENEKVIELDPDQAQFTRRITERAVRFIEANKARPFFLYVPHVMPHVPIFASEKFRGTSQRGLYGDVIQELDWSIGEILAALAKHGLTDNTLVIYTSDNGPNLSYGEHAGSAKPFREGKRTAFEGGVREPCLMRWPGKVPAGRVCDELVTTLDLFETLAHLIGAKLPARKRDGIDLSPLLLGKKDAKGRDVFWYYSGAELHAVRQGDWKLHLPHEYLTMAGEPGKGGKPSNYGKLKPESIQLSGIRGIASRHGYRFEKMELALYNLKDDPAESKNVADQNPDVVKRLQAIAAEARADLGDALQKKPGPNVRAPGNHAEPIKLIFDTDIGNDVDDVLALGMIHALQSRGVCDLLAVTITKDHELAGPFVDAINTFYGRPNIPIGVVRGGATRDEGKFLGMVRDAAAYPHALKKSSDAPEAVALLRKVLAAQPDGSVVLVQVGFATNLARLLASPADGVSPLTGKDLAAKKVKFVSAMFGAYRPDGAASTLREYNVVEDLPAGKKFAADWPTPIVFSGFEVGQAITYPAASIEKDFRYARNHPLAEAYRRYSPPPHERPCWDLTSVLYAVYPDRDYFGLSAPGRVTVGDDGITRFAPAEKGGHRFLTVSKEQALRCRVAFSFLASQPPGAAAPR